MTLLPNLLFLNVDFSIFFSSKSADRFRRYSFLAIALSSRESIFFKFCVGIVLKKTDLLTLVSCGRAIPFRSYGCSKFLQKFKNFEKSNFFGFFGKLSQETMILGIKNNF